MARAKFSTLSPFETLTLSASDKRRLQKFATHAVQKNVSEYEQLYHAQQQQQQAEGAVSFVDSHRWSVVKQREGLRVFVQRRSYQKTRASSSDKSSPHSERQPSPPTDDGLPVMLVTGTTLGSLDDMMLGVVNATLDAMRLKSLYVRDHVCDAAVLATLALPSLENPFSSFTVKWMEYDPPPHLRALIKSRDFVYMETTGLIPKSQASTDGDSVRIGYHFLHSINFPETRELESHTRGSLSVCGLYIERASRPGVVEVFVKGVVDLAGDILRAVAIQASANALVSVCRNLDCALSKKLAWRLQQEQHKESQRQSSCCNGTRQPSGGSPTFSSSLRSTSSTETSSLSLQLQQQCATCQQGLSRGGGSGGGLLARSSSDALNSCELCLQRLCSRCTIRKELGWLTRPAAPLLPQVALSTHAFCARCLRETSELCTIRVMRAEILEAGG